MATNQSGSTNGEDGRSPWFTRGDAFRLAAVAAGGSLIALGLRNGGSRRNVMSAGGAGMVLGGLLGMTPIHRVLGLDVRRMSGRLRPLDLQTTITVNAPREEVMAYWRQIENLPRFMKHLSEVRQIGEGRSHWVAEVPGGLGTIAWDAEVRTDDSRLSWRSVPGSPIENTGEVIFRDAPGHRGTEIRARISYRPPAGTVGHATSKLLTPVFNQLVKEDIRRFKHVMEAGEVPTA